MRGPLIKVPLGTDYSRPPSSWLSRYKSFLLLAVTFFGCNLPWSRPSKTYLVKWPFSFLTECICSIFTQVCNVAFSPKKQKCMTTDSFPSNFPACCCPIVLEVFLWPGVLRAICLNACCASPFLSQFQNGGDLEEKRLFSASNKNFEERPRFFRENATGICIKWDDIIFQTIPHIFAVWITPWTQWQTSWWQYELPFPVKTSESNKRRGKLRSIIS